jgi:uncharacterized protein YdeI (YjbR/CyaY-like superfamily)
MPTTDPRVDAYIAKAAAFARSILEELRARVHAACPDVVETVKWGAPAFMHHGPLAGMAGFKAHCAFGFWKHALLLPGDARADTAWGSFGRIESLADLPSKAVFRALVRKAMQLNEQGVKVPRPRAKPRPEAKLHPEFAAALAAAPKARAVFDAFAPSHRREYAEWITEAKRDETRARRIEQAITWLAEGKQRHWKHQ